MNFQKTIRLGSVLLLLFGLNIAAQAQSGQAYDRWEQLGRSYVDGTRDTDRILVSNSSSFRALQLEVRGGAIEFQRVVVHFDNGADVDLEIRERIPSGGKTRVIDLPGDRRRIRSVEFWYSRSRWTSRPYVNLLGQRSYGGGSGGGPGGGTGGGSGGGPYQDRWEQLGRTYVDGRRDTDRILVNNSSSFRALQLEVRGGAIEFQRVLVHFDNGADVDLDIRERIPSGGKTRVLDLPGDRRRIRSVEFWYSRDRWTSRPYVNLLGQRGFGGGSGGGGDESQWEQLGASYVDGRVDHDRIVVNTPGAFRALQLGIRRGTIEFQRVVVHFESGEDHELQIPDRITAPAKTRVIDLPGNRRRIQSVEFWYSKENFRERPHVNLWGRR